MQYRNVLRLLCLIALCFTISCSTNSSFDEIGDLEEEVEEDVEYHKFLSLYPNEISYLVYDLDLDEVTISHNDEDELIPASIQKIFTNYAALEVLGSNAKFNTTLYHNGEIHNGVLFGDLVLEAGGDPDLKISDLANIAFAVLNFGITEIKGDIIYDDSFFPTIPQIDEAQPDYAKYNQTVSPFSFENNHYRIIQNGQTSNLITVPRTNQLSYRSKRRLFNNYRSNTKESRYNLSFLAKREAILPMRDPAFYTAITLQDLLQNLGVNSLRVRGYKNINAQRLKDLNIVHIHQSDELAKHVSASLLHSNNLVTEVLLLHTVKMLGCDYRTLEDAAKCLNSWYQENFPEHDWHMLDWKNGSGLSDSTRITTKHLNSVLRSAFNKQYEDKYFVSYLPISGITGTLRNKFSDKSLKIAAKTGTMNYVSSLAGYFFTGEKKYAFVIVVNNSVMRDIMYHSADASLRKKTRSFLKRWYSDALEIQSRVLDEYL